MLFRMRSTVVVGACAVWLSGCNIVAPAYLLVHGPPKLEKAHELEADRTTVVVIDDLQSRLPRSRLRATIAETVEADLLKHKVVRDLVSSRSALALVSQERAGEVRTVGEIGEALGADVVVSVSVEAFSLSATGAEYQPLCALRVRVFDVEKGERIWPTDRDYYSLVLQPPVRTADVPKTQTEIAQAELRLAEYAGHGVAELFFSQERHRAARAGQETK